ncbi:MAG: carbon-nitrogen hydrolase family protein [Pirellulales bacterium]
MRTASRLLIVVVALCWAAPVVGQEVPATGQTVRVAGIVLKWVRGDKEMNFRRAEQMIRSAADGGARLVCTTECFLDGYAIADKSIPLETYRALGEPIPEGAYFQKLVSLADELEIHLLAGMLEADGEDRYNTAVLIGPDGKLIGKYRKQKLGHEVDRNQAGSESLVFDTAIGRVGVMICADRTEPGIVSRYREQGAEFLLCPSGGMFGPDSNDPIVQARSRENSLPIVFVHPAEFLVTNSDGTIAARTLLGDRLEIASKDIGTATDSSQTIFFELSPAGTKTAVEPARELRVAAVQMRSSRVLADNVAKTKDYLARCASQGVRVAVFPECSVTGYFDNEFMQSFTAEVLSAAEREIADSCREHDIYAVIGMPVREGEKLYNSAVVIAPTGRIIERYHKLQLAESWPDPGDHLSVFRIDGIACSVIVCHDERYPELVRLPVLAGARLVFYISHESGLDSPRKMTPYRAQIQARAVENSVYVVQANAPANEDSSGSHGESRIIAPDGNLIQEAGIDDEESVIATLEMKHATGWLARRSLELGVLGDWWKGGVERVRILE